MIKTNQGWSWQFVLAGALATGGVLHFCGSRALAQNITLDGSFGSAGTLMGPNYVIPQAVGRTVGTNLFHSFGIFNLPNADDVAIFESASNITNILSRVTGGSSTINGTIRSISTINGTIQSSTANIFLINPAGIIFGSNARLDIGGSFVGTTANAIWFPNGGEFSMNSPVVSNNPVLVVNPSALFFNQTPAGISVNQSILQVNPGKNLFLVGGNVTLDGGTVRAPGGRIELGGLAEAGVVEIKEFISDRSNPNSRDRGAVRLSFPEGVARADVVLTNGAIADVTGENKGDIAINARNISLSGPAPSNICAGIGSNTDCGGVSGQSAGTDSSRAGNVILNATGDVKLSALSRIANNVNPNATGNNDVDIFEAVIEAIKTGDSSVIFGSVFITANSLSVTEGASISTSTYGTGNAGLVYVNAKDSVSLAGYQDVSGVRSRSRLASLVAEGATGNAGGIFIKTGSLSLTDYSNINSSTYGGGSAGAVIVDASGAVSLANDSVIFNNVEAGGNGASGVIDITAKSLSLTNGSQLQTIVREAENGLPPGIGSAGTINITTSDTVTISGFGHPAFGNQGVALPSAIFSRTGSEVSGNAGNIEISTRSLSLSDGGKIDTNLGGVGVAGSIFIDATDSVSLSNNARIDSVIEQGATQNTGSTNPFAGGIIDALLGQGGEVTGTILISTGSLSLKDGSLLNTSTNGNGNAGGIVIVARNDVSLKGAEIDSVVGDDATGDAGAILMSVGSLSISSTPNNPAGLTTQTSPGGTGDAGLILVFADKDISITGDNSGNESVITSRVAEGSENDSGAIGLYARSLFLKDGASVSVDNQGSGFAGDIVIQLREDVILRNQATINARATSGQGGNIVLLPDTFLVLLENSRISTTSGFEGKGGDGGNVGIIDRYTIAAPFDDNNINANAFTGKGGKIIIFSNRLYDIQKRPDIPTRNDITASSDFGLDGTVAATVLNLDPTQGLSNLPTDSIDPTRLIAETCAPRGGITERQKNQFIVTRRGGLPPDPNAAFPGEAVVTDQGTPNQQNNQPNSPHSTNPASSPPVATASSQRQEQPDHPGSTNPTGATPTEIASPQPPENQPNNPSSTKPASSPPVATASPQQQQNQPDSPGSTNSTSATPTVSASPQQPIVEAQGWVFDKNGDIKFTNEAPTVIPNHSELTPASTCNGLSTQP